MSTFFDNLANKAKSMSNQLSDKARDSSEQRRLEGEIKQVGQEIEKIYTALGKNLYESRVNGQQEDFEAGITRITELKALIDGKNKRIEEIRSQIACPYCGRMMPAGTEFCSACGRPMVKPEEPDIETADDTIVEGSAVEIPEKHCPNCGAVIRPDDVFCIRCGMPLKSASEEETEEDISEETGEGYMTTEEASEQESPVEEAPSVEESPTEEVEKPAEEESVEETEKEPEPEQPAEEAEKISERRCPVCGSIVGPEDVFCIRCGAALERH